VKRVLLTGMSGTGKVEALSRAAPGPPRGYKAVDKPDRMGGSEPWPEWPSEVAGGGYPGTVWLPKDADVLFVAGCEENQVQFHAQFRPHRAAERRPPRDSGGAVGDQNQQLVRPRHPKSSAGS